MIRLCSEQQLASLEDRADHRCVEGVQVASDGQRDGRGRRDADAMTLDDIGLGHEAIEQGIALLRIRTGGTPVAEPRDADIRGVGRVRDPGPGG